MSRTCICLSIVLSFIFPCYLHAVIKGSETVVSVEPLATFLSADNDNTMLGFGWFKNGFTLEDSSTTCTFDSVYPVSGNINFNGGQLYLSRDLQFQNVTNLDDSGSIFANNYSVELCSSVTELFSTYTLHDVTLCLGGDLKITQTIVFDGNCRIDGRNYNIFFEDNGTIIVGSGSTLELDDVHLDNLGGVNISCQDDSSKIILHNVDWTQSDDFRFKKGSIEFSHGVRFCGDKTFFYESSQTSTINANTRWTITDKMILEIGRDKAVDYVEPLCFVDESSILRLDNCSLIVTASGIGLTKGEFEFDRDVYVDVLSSTTTHGLIIGSGQEVDDFSMKLDAGVSVHLNSGCWTYNNYNASGKLHALSEESRCIRYDNSKFYVMRDWIIPSMVFKIASGRPENVIVDGANLSYDDTHIFCSGSSFLVSGKEMLPGFKLDGEDSLFMNMGAMQLPVYVSGTGNLIHGNGKIVGTVSLQDSDAELSCNLDGCFTENITLNGGKLILLGQLNLESDTVLTGSGTVDLDGYRAKFGAKNCQWTSDILWESQDGSLELDSNIELKGTWTFDGTCVVDGSNNTLCFGETGAIEVAPDSKVTFRNIVLKCTSGQNIKCLSDTGNIEFDNVKWVQSGHFTFDTGSLLFTEASDFVGSYSFIYDSSQTSTISARGKWGIGEGLTLKIGRKEIVDPIEPLYFENSTSLMTLEDCSFIVTASGLTLTNGEIEVNGAVSLSMESTSTVYGLSLGNGIAEDDFTLKIRPGSTLKFLEGCWVYSNSVPTGKFIVSSANTHLFRYANSIAYSATDWTLPSMVIKNVTGFPVTVVPEGVNLNYDNVRIVIGSIDFDYVGALLPNTVFTLNGNNSLNLNKGVFPLPLTVTGSGNYLRGTGDVGAPIILGGPTSELICHFGGSILSSPILNNGTMTLSRNINFGPDISFANKGTVDLNNYQMIFGPKDMEWSSDVFWEGTGGSLSLRANLDLSGTWTFDGNCILDGGGNVLNLGDTGSIIVAPNTLLTMRNVVIQSVSGNNICCLDDDSSIELDNVTWIQDEHFTFTTGSMEFTNYVDFKGSYSFVYDSSQTSTINTRSKWSVFDGVTLKIGRKEAIDYNEPLCFVDGTASLSFENCSFIVTASGMNLSKGDIEIDGDVELSMLSTSTIFGLSMGTGVPSEDLTLKLHSGASLKFKTGCWIYNNSVPSGRFIALSSNACLLRYADSVAYVARDWTLPQMTIKNMTGVPTTVVADGADLNYENVHIVFGSLDFDFDGHAPFSLLGNDSLNINKGVFPLPLTVLGTGNYLRGSGDIGAPLIMQTSDTELTCHLSGSIQSSPLLNGGKIILAGDLYFGPEIVFANAGQVNLSSYRMVLSSKDCTWNSNTSWEGDGGSIAMRSGVDLKGTWSFSGETVIDGRGNTLFLGQDGNLVVESGSKLILRDLVLSGPAGTNIKCLDDTATIEFDDITWIQDDNFMFDVGSIEFTNAVDFTGSYSFVYDSSQTSTIKVRSHWGIRDGMVLQIGRKEVVDYVEPLSFEDGTSKLLLKDCSMITTASGMMLTKGEAEVKGEVELSMLSTNSMYGLIFGSGQEAGDFSTKIRADAMLKLVSGCWVYNNSIATGCFTTLSDTAKFVRYGGSIAYIAKDWTLPSMIVENVYGLPTTIIPDGINLSYSNVDIVIGSIDFTFDGQQSSASMFVLSGDNSVTLNKGVFPLPVTITGVGNYLRGTGDVGGPLIVAGPGTELNSHFSGNVLSSPIMAGGKIILSSDLTFGPNVSLSGSGFVDLGNDRLFSGAADQTW
ncbi:hypothetical protein KAH94_00105, partial [bacterium]|nr:hypothetical protein [bacterium]